LSAPKRLLAEGEELPKEVELKPGVEDEPKGEVPVRLKGDVPKGVDVLELDEVPNTVDGLVLVPVVVAGKVEVPEEAPEMEDGGGKENPDDDDADDELEPSIPKPANVGGAGTDDGFELGTDDADGNGSVELDGLLLNSV
jgi:hypothetical protein